MPSKLCISALIVVLVFLNSCAKEPEPRLFQHGYYAAHPDRPGRHWVPIEPIQDQSGNVVYFDFRLNLVVLILINDPSHGVYTIPRDTTTKSATLMTGSPHQVQITKDKDVLLVFRLGKELGRIRLGTDTALGLREELWNITQQPTSNLSLSTAISNHLSGNEKQQMMNILNSLE